MKPSYRTLRLKTARASSGGEIFFFFVVFQVRSFLAPRRLEM